ncbi:hypothetical protein QCD60_30490 [Pokkaliibacter sp. MBI-7]|uniref:hypothetical protein n=1 Tax=Pokkaliibacter sp. MBI-7 TaxID=3040600 RepID=UPI00244960F0|nr:hypothetical protein [Pokkaliibacter sp. MBI-7]MDH2436846.1 hypothetical protein [Pokkaliibacter sp. MBI-7]
MRDLVVGVTLGVIIVFLVFGAIALWSRDEEKSGAALASIKIGLLAGVIALASAYFFYGQ